MKKSLCFVLALTLGIAVVGNVMAGGSRQSGGESKGSKERKIESNVPDFVKQAIKNVPEDSLVAVGVSKIKDIGLAKQRAEVLARGDFTRQLQALTSTMIRDYAAANEADPSAAVGFTEALNTALGKQNLVGARITEYDVIDGVTWVVMEMPRSSQKSVIGQAASTAKLKPGYDAALNAEERMEAAFEKNNFYSVPVVTE